MSLLIEPGELPRWVPGQLLESSDGLGWQGVGLRTWRYKPQDVEVPALSHFMIVAYRRGSTRMARRFEGRWSQAECHPGDISLLTRSQGSHWHWTSEIDVRHAYLPEATLSTVAADMLERPIADIRLHDLLNVRDPVVNGIVDAIAAETTANAPGGAICVEALGMQLAVHLLRRYASVSCREPKSLGGLPPAVTRRLRDYIDTHLQEPLTLEQLAQQAGMGPWSFGKRFRQSFGQAPHAYLVERRVERARQLLAQGRLPVKAVASACGFSDQAHLTRVMQQKLGVTPGALRRAVIGTN